MRLQLACVVVLVLGVTRTAHAQDDDSSASASVGVYADTDHMVVVSPRTGARLVVSEQLSLDVAVAADVITGASVDVVSEASPTAIREVRVEGAVGVLYRWRPALTTRLRGRASHEEDYLALVAEFGVALELRQRTTTVDLSLSLGSDSVEAVTRPELHARRSEQRLTATLTQVVNRRTYVDAIVESHRRAGLLSNPYRSVPLVGPGTPMITRVDEVVPDERRAIAGALVLRRAFGANVFARGSYRFYRDDWDVSSHTVRAMWMIAGGQWRGGVEGRVYVQSAAEFYRREYGFEAGQVPALRTRERRLGAMSSASGSVTVERAIGSAWRGIGSVSLVRFLWHDFAAQARRDAAMVTIGVNRLF